MANVLVEVMVFNQFDTHVSLNKYKCRCNYNKWGLMLNSGPSLVFNFTWLHAKNCCSRPFWHVGLGRRQQ